MARAPGTEALPWNERGVVEVASPVSGVITIPATGRLTVCRVTGTNNITSVTASAEDRGRVIVLTFSGILTFTDGANLKLAGNLVTSADDTITLVCPDGVNWHEMARSVN